MQPPPPPADPLNSAAPNASPAAAPPPRGSHHRRVRSELPPRTADDLGARDLNVFCGIGSFFSALTDVQGHISNASAETTASRPMHRHSSSVDGSAMPGVSSDVIEAKKAMTADQLAELAAVDPKRAKRILANRQSATHSKERKARYMSELERKVLTLQTEATTLSAHLTLYQRDTTGLTAENAELQLRLQDMEQQAQLCEALNGALKQEVQRLMIATGEMSNRSGTYNMGLQHIGYNMPFCALPQ